jgi:hypothetical protein
VDGSTQLGWRGVIPNGADADADDDSDGPNDSVSPNDREREGDATAAVRETLSGATRTDGFVAIRERVARAHRIAPRRHSAAHRRRAARRICNGRRAAFTFGIRHRDAPRGRPCLGVAVAGWFAPSPRFRGVHAVAP